MMTSPTCSKAISDASLHCREDSRIVDSDGASGGDAGLTHDLDREATGSTAATGPGARSKISSRPRADGTCWATRLLVA
jgi:hypothetical protein